MNELSISLGCGRKRPQGTRQALDESDPISSLIDALDNRNPASELWWSPHIWEGDKRAEKNWTHSVGAALDLDYHNETGIHSEPPIEKRKKIDEAAKEGVLPGNLFHHTPRGARLIAVWDTPTTTEADQRMASEALARAATIALGLIGVAPERSGVNGYVVDDRVVRDLGRLLFAHNAIVDGKPRRAKLIRLNSKPYSSDNVQKIFPHPDDQKKDEEEVEIRRVVNWDEAVEKYNRDHAHDWNKLKETPGTNPGICPLCGGGKNSGCFHALPSDPSKGYCFSDQHWSKAPVGHPASNGTGILFDALDHDSFLSGRKAVELLKEGGYIDDATFTVSKGGKVEHLPIYGQTFANLVTILSSSTLQTEVAGGEIKFNEMLISPMIDGVKVEDHAYSGIRVRIENKLYSLKPAKGDAAPEKKPLLFSKTDIADGVDYVARQNTYHPVRDWLKSLVWDQTPRISRVATDILGARTESSEELGLTIEMIYRWFVSAVARPLKPGCKVDTVLVLVGKQRAGKSTFYSILGGGSPWFCDSPVSIGSKDAYQTLASCWLLEWAELESIKRARDQEAVKAFISSQVDVFRPPYARNSVIAPRACVIVGSTNEGAFLSDMTGNRRFWPVKVADEIDVGLAAEWRDQLWAEAVHCFRRGDRWWLDDQFEATLEKMNQEFERVDPWEHEIAHFLIGREEVTVNELLRGPLDKQKGQWNRGDTMRVANILKKIGWGKKKGGGKNLWAPAGAQVQEELI
jgi:hypothetical protein